MSDSLAHKSFSIAWVKTSAPMRRVGLARALSKLGHCSRTQAFELIGAGRVRLNGATRLDPETPVRLEVDRIEVEGKPLVAADKLYVALNKPRGVVTTAADEKNRKTVYDLLDVTLPWIAPVGRLDKASEGLLLLTNDSEWAAGVLAPETHLDKIYHVQVGALVDAAMIERMSAGVAVSSREVLQLKRATILREGARNTWLEVTLEEGKNRHIRRLLAALSIDVLRLVRVAIGPLALGKLAKGASRQLRKGEKEAMDHAMARVGCGR